MSSRQRFSRSSGWQWRTARGAGCARTSNYVRRSIIPSRRPCLARASMLACMLVLSTPRSTSLILAQQTYGTASTMTLSVLRLLRWARYMYGHRGLRGLVLGPGSTVSFLVGACSSTSVYPTTRLLRWWWDRRGRNSCPRSLLLWWHVDEEDEDLARVHAGSGSHNLDAPYLTRQRCRGKRTPMGQGPFRSGRERRPHEEQIEANTRAIFTQLRSSPER